MLPPLPPLLIFITLVVVVIPSLITIFLRIYLHRYLINLINIIQKLIKKEASVKAPIVQTLENRFKQASKQLEQVNTTALIDQIYSQEKIDGKGLTCEQIDYLCRILPNLLLAFGLLGTFFGITINLSTLSQTINQTNAIDMSNLVAELKKPLEGMSIAFTTSLTGLFFSALLTVINFFFNSGIAKYRLLSSLEDYLDNIYFPQEQGDTRLDKIVNRMVDQQDVFLTNFGKTVREAVEQSMGKVAQQIADGNRETTDLARQVYEKFTDAAGTISRAADDFENSMTALNKTSQIFKESAETFNRSDFPLKLSLATVDLSNTQQKFSESATSLAATAELIQTALSEIQNCSHALMGLADDIKSINQSSIQVLDLHQSNQNILSEIIPKLKQGANIYQKAVNKLDNLDKKIADKANNLDSIITAINQLIATVTAYTAEVNSAILVASNQLDEHNPKTHTLDSNMETYIQQSSLDFRKIHSDSMKLLHNSTTQLLSEYQTVSNNMSKSIVQQTGINKKGFEIIISNLQECNKNLYDTKSAIMRLKQGVE
ncbi:hypothetical protein A0J48_020250 [Sphaerospermopsis aphanizomenoides BCCUSP55]|uniref:hypothetical protein n=1 Tax=Sphaerospermopsis aphanizomenoides TaxID=459663 RepID=UPI0019047466|nr:hypothetical protein [Sphaerospermopsis aphanizomenoides]MBK1989832.1 hypothetical protein [Sphaerospermopsis aphanizomenoides BCCUSP55]